MSTSIDVDDTAPGIFYSSGWSGVQDSQAYGSDAHSTSSVGATATIRFSGNWIKVFGTNPSSPGGGNIQATFQIDGQPNQSWTRDSHGTAYHQDLFWESWQIADGTHTLVVTNTGSQVPFILDYFTVEGSSPAVISSRLSINPPPPATSVTVTLPVSTPSKPTTSVITAIQTVTSTETSIATHLSSSNVIATSESSSSYSSSAGVQIGLSVDPVNGKTVTAFQVITTSISGQPAEVTLYHATGATGKNGLAIGAIIGIVLGALLFLLLLLFVLLFLRRRRRLLASSNIDENSEGAGNMRQNQRASGSVRPFSINNMNQAFTSPFTATISSKPGLRHADGRPFYPIDEDSSVDHPSANSRPTPTTESPPSLTLNLYLNEKASSSPGTTSSPSGRIYSSDFSETNNGTEAPPAYHSVISPSRHTSYVPG